MRTTVPDRINGGAGHGSTSSGAMTLQSSRGCEASPQKFVRLSGSHLPKPRAA